MVLENDSMLDLVGMEDMRTLDLPSLEGVPLAANDLWGTIFD